MSLRPSVVVALLEIHMVPLGLSTTALAHALGVTPARINDIVRGRRGINRLKRLRGKEWSVSVHRFVYGPDIL